jgi:hypothetical protein
MLGEDTGNVPAEFSLATVVAIAVSSLNGFHYLTVSTGGCRRLKRVKRGRRPMFSDGRRE